VLVRFYGTVPADTHRLLITLVFSCSSLDIGLKASRNRPTYQTLSGQSSATPRHDAFSSARPSFFSLSLFLPYSGLFALPVLAFHSFPTPVSFLFPLTSAHDCLQHM